MRYDEKNLQDQLNAMTRVLDDSVSRVEQLESWSPNTVPDLNVRVGQIERSETGWQKSLRERLEALEAQPRTTILPFNQLPTILETDPRLYTAEQVAALVKAARAALNSGNSPNDVWQALEAALKPFEGVK